MCSTCAAGKLPTSTPLDDPLHFRPPHLGRSGGGQHRVLENRCLGPEGQVACRKGVCHLIAYGGIGALASYGGVSAWEVGSIARGQGAEARRTGHWQVVHQARVPGWCGYDVEVGVGM